jgi:plasmid stabilization system protein ParE
MAIRVQEAASRRLDAIFRYTRDRWGEARAEEYIAGLFTACEGIQSHATLSRPVPAEFGVSGFFFKYRRHIVYWRRLANGDIGIVTVLHERMHLIERFREDFGA